MREIRLDSSLASKLKVGILLQDEVHVDLERNAKLREAIHEAEREVLQVYHSRKPSEIEGLRPARALFRSIGVDPTRMRPASEALLRRVLKGGFIPSINTAVDAVNLVSLELLLPVGLYDADLVVGDIDLRLGEPGEGYERIGSGRINLEGRIGLFDGKGGFGNPTGDSKRTSVTAATRRLIFVLFTPASTPVESLGEKIDFAARSLAEHTGSRRSGHCFLGGGLDCRGTIA